MGDGGQGKAAPKATASSLSETEADGVGNAAGINTNTSTTPATATTPATPNASPGIGGVLPNTEGSTPASANIRVEPEAVAGASSASASGTVSGEPKGSLEGVVAQSGVSSGHPTPLASTAAVDMTADNKAGGDSGESDGAKVTGGGVSNGGEAVADAVSPAAASAASAADPTAAWEPALEAAVARFEQGIVISYIFRAWMYVSRGKGWWCRRVEMHCRFHRASYSAQQFAAGEEA